MSAGPETTRTGRADPLRRPKVAHHRGLPARPSPHPVSPAASDLDAIRAYTAASRSRPTAVDLFCGAGGLSLGLTRAGFDVLAAADSDEWAMRTHDANLPGLSWCGDLADPAEFLAALDVWGISHVDLVAGGVPCQPFSRAGHSRIRGLVQAGERMDHDSRADLWSSFVSVVESLRPSAVLVENVPDLPRWNDGAVLLGLYDSLQALGYRVEARVLDAFRFGVPQHRQRLILIGLADGRQPLWPTPDDNLVSLRDAIGDLPPIPRAQRAERLPYDARRQTSPFQALMRRDVPPDGARLVTEHISRDVRDDDMEAFRLLREGQTYIDLPERLQRYRSDVFTDKYKRLAWAELCRSITAHIAKDGYWYIHPDQHRTLSVREAARVQSFPDDVSFAGTQTHRYRQIGNAVPVLLGEAIGGAVIAGLQQPAVADGARGAVGFREALLAWTAAWTPPWRKAGTAWDVLLCELLLARARPADAERLFADLRSLAPTPAALCRLDDPELALAGIGIKDRAALAVKVARVLVEEHAGEVPDTEAALAELPGVGDYVCRAVLAFAWGRRQVLVDRTTARVATRVTGHRDDRRFQLRLDLHRLAGSRGPDPSFNRALLDLGRELCRPANPDCPACPLRSHCAFARDLPPQLELEVASPLPEEVAA